MTNVKQLRSEILKYLYENRASHWVETQDLLEYLKVSEKELHTEILYLKGKYLLETAAEAVGKEFLYFNFLNITSNGIDLVENPESGEGFVSININTFRDVSNSNLSIGSRDINQNLNISNVDEGLTQKIEELKQALEEKNQSKVLTILKYIGDKSVDLLISIIASGLLQK